MVKVLNGAATRLQSEDELLRQSLYDTVTDVPNRRFLLSSLSELLKTPGNVDQHMAVISLGLVNRRAIHESLGHDAGDSFLSEIGQRIAMLLTLDETLARSDGDEFVILSPELSTADAASERVRDLLTRVAGPVAIEGFELPPHLVAGVVIAKIDPQVRPEDLLRDASAAMYRAVAEDVKLAVFDEAMRAETVERLSLVAELRRAIDTRSLYLVYQPVVSRAEAQVTKYEALVRWSHPVRGEIGPARFVPLAETHGLIGRLGSYVLAESLDQLRRWRDAGDTLGNRSMGVNISRAQLDDPGLAEEILGALAERELEPACLMIEVTESALTGDSQAALETVKALADAGVQIALDDFGVGQSSLASLTELPLDVLKLDRSLVHDVVDSPQRIAIMSAVSQIAQTLDLMVVAEGIETEEEARITSELGCDLGQGWFYARPTPADELPTIVAKLDASLAADRLREDGVSDAGLAA
jgi:diguanylate cyclase (GGDEF)-like protein